MTFSTDFHHSLFRTKVFNSVPDKVVIKLPISYLLINKKWSCLRTYIKWDQRKLTVGGSITVLLVSVSLHTKNNKFYFLVKSSLVKLETCSTVILPPTVSVLCWDILTKKRDARFEAKPLEGEANVLKSTNDAMLRYPFSHWEHTRIGISKYLCDYWEV